MLAEAYSLDGDKLARLFSVVVGVDHEVVAFKIVAWRRKNTQAKVDDATAIFEEEQDCLRVHGVLVRRQVVNHAGEVARHAFFPLSRVCVGHPQVRDNAVHVAQAALNEVLVLAPCKLLGGIGRLKVKRVYNLSKHACALILNRCLGGRHQELQFRSVGGAICEMLTQMCNSWTRWPLDLFRKLRNLWPQVRRKTVVAHKLLRNHGWKCVADLDV